jgi:steroid delta-isomerase-like uncharacterized protein
MAEQDLIRVARENIDAFSAGDWQRFRATMTPDIVYNELATQRRVEGPDAYLQLARGWKEAFPDGRGAVTNAFVSANTVTLEITWEGTQTGPLTGPAGTIPASGKAMKFRAAGVITIQGEKIKEFNHYFDLMTMLQQIGAAPQ